jgi:hypothetical protein
LEPDGLGGHDPNLDLDNLLSQRSNLDKQLVHLQKFAKVLDIMAANSQHMVASVSSTCDLADQVSRKVHELDLVASTPLLRIDAIVNRSSCIDGVKKALETKDFESAAKYVHTFLHIDAKYKDSEFD